MRYLSRFATSFSCCCVVESKRMACTPLLSRLATPLPLPLHQSPTPATPPQSPPSPTHTDQLQIPEIASLQSHRNFKYSAAFRLSALNFRPLQEFLYANHALHVGASGSTRRQKNKKSSRTGQDTKRLSEKLSSTFASLSIACIWSRSLYPNWRRVTIARTLACGYARMLSNYCLCHAFCFSLKLIIHKTACVLSLSTLPGTSRSASDNAFN